MAPVLTENVKRPMPDIPQHSLLDPQNWDDFRRVAHELLDACIDQMAAAGSRPWKPLPEGQAAAYALDGAPHDLSATAERLRNEVMPYHSGNTHPRFFGWVQGTGLATGLLSEMVAVTMNSNCGGRDHGANEIERSVIDWTRQVMGFPAGASGVLVTGTSIATVIALVCARQRAMPDSRTAGIAHQPGAVYAGVGAHNAIRKAVELVGLGSHSVRDIRQGAAGLDLDHLRACIQADRQAGMRPVAIVGTAGSVDLGRFDDLNALADLARDEGIWLHVDGAFGAWTRLASAPWHQLSEGIGRADSLACDFHKWMYVPYDCGVVLIRDEAAHRAAFAARPSYLAGQSRGLGGGEPWFCDYGIDLSRGPRALRVWTAIQHYGAERFGQAISANCAAAALMAELVEQDDRMALAAPVVSNVCVFTADARLSDKDQSLQNTRIAQDLQVAGQAVLSTTMIEGRTVLRAAITNHRTTEMDIRLTIEAVAAARDAQPLSNPSYD